MKIGIPRALLYYRYAVLWETFFSELGMETVLSPRTTKALQDTGDRYAIDENCLSSKLFLGHVAALEGKCDMVFIPRIANFGKEGVLCSRFEAIYDICANTFREKNLRFLSCDVDPQQKKPEKEAYIGLARELNKTRPEAEAAWQKARQAWEADIQNKIRKQEAALAATDKIRVLVVGHSYNLYDEYIGQPILKGIRRLDALPVCSDAVDLTQAQKDSLRICERVPWIMSRELLGAIQKYHDCVDGIILLTAFPCGPDSMVNEMIIRRVKDRPILNLLLDSQDASAGIETRLESFIDIIRFRKELNANA
ncbi:MAG: acyl-CoA dehydratase activase-related protein [Clostridiales bacterium]|nr:acyl-CoA dehydratase activase-related protein [Clostridiales bacterium]MCD8109272.1 acyl-CoA dehydratase activase-related protein [Clostridiales bacterium]